MNAVVFGIFLAAIIASVTAESGSISVLNLGGYIGKFTVEYKLKGETVSKDSGNFALGFNKTITIPEGATNITVKASLYWFINALSDIFTESFPGPVKKCYKVWGIPLSPQYAAIAC